MNQYVFDNADPRNRTRFDSLAVFDPDSHAALAAAGVGPGWKCWEIGCGDGGIGRWLADRVGPGGSVLATDIDTRWLSGDGPVLTVREHDVVRDEPPATDFDLIHARLVLIHLPQRHAVVDRLVSSLRPGGKLVLEEFDLEHPLTTRSTTHRAAFDAVHLPFLRFLRARGVGLDWARSLAEEFVDRGLRDVDVRTRTVLWRGGADEIRLYRVNVEQAAEHLLADGVSTRQLTDFYALLDNPEFTAWSHPLVSVSGTRPV
ncbi:class I SAM-dependent methyltransferase [Actinokineospora auranticolor]|uniref:Ubiquinone/menaquinone biosynthesis C-methylase UbiE n=1 Tax=Actinokineospora auranticolor TaxID=155976 RepID=A0A2S6GPN2_9PSEU|nr:class I SAM-dependent methyltransferase [Actinokineospora auranticolor]PPK67212.1 ubiquinone/menaquinone biosynthesis C-methylase UbiE [Actinokineospora auranticolor]